MNVDFSKKEVNVFQILLLLLKKWWLILISAIIFAVLAFIGTHLLIAPEYEASVKMNVNNSVTLVDGQSLSISSADITASQTLVDTYSVILDTRLTLDEVKKETGVKYSFEELSKMISSEAVDETSVLEVKVRSKDPKEACKIANAVAKVLPDKISDIVEGSSVSIVDYAVEPDKPSSPSYLKISAIGFILGAMIGVLLIILMTFMNDTIDSEEWLHERYSEEVPLLAVIPDVNSRENRSRYSRYYGSYGEVK